MPTHEISLDFNKSIALVQPEVIVRVGDADSQVIQATLYDDGIPYTPTGELRIQIERRDGGLIITRVMTQVSANVYKATLPGVACAWHGETRQAYVAEYHDGKVYATTSSFKLKILPGTTTEESIKYFDEELQEIRDAADSIGSEVEENEAQRQSNERERETYFSTLKSELEAGKYSGATFTPHVAENGDLTWTNNQSMPNPKKVNLMGPEGPRGLTGDEGPEGDVGPAGPTGEPGATFTPNVAENGDLTWTNNGELPNPQQVNIMGPKGDKGDTGEGLNVLGVYASLDEIKQHHESGERVGDAYMGGSHYYVWNGSEWQDCGELQGAKGEPGAAAAFAKVTATIDGGNGDPSVEASMDGPNTAKELTLAFHDLQGPKGETGDKGDTGPYYTPSVDQEGELTWQGSSEDLPPIPSAKIKGEKGERGERGEQGPPGENATITGLASEESPGLLRQLSGSEDQVLLGTGEWGEYQPLDTFKAQQAQKDSEQDSAIQEAKDAAEAASKATPALVTSEAAGTVPAFPAEGAAFLFADRGELSWAGEASDTSLLDDAIEAAEEAKAGVYVSTDGKGIPPKSKYVTDQTILDNITSAIHVASVVQAASSIEGLIVLQSQVNSATSTLTQATQTFTGLVQVSPEEITIADMSWEQIASISSDAAKSPDEYAEYLGKTKAIDLSSIGGSKDVTAMIIGIGQDVSPQGKKLGFTFQLRDGLPCQAFKMGSSDSTAGGWRDCFMRSTGMPKIKAAMPEELRSRLKTMVKKTHLTPTAAALVETQDELALLSQTEVWGDEVNPQEAWIVPKGEGEQYQWYAQHNTNQDRTIKRADGRADFWWLRSVRTEGLFRCVNNGGYISNLSPHNEYMPCACFSV